MAASVNEGNINGRLIHIINQGGDVSHYDNEVGGSTTKRKKSKMVPIEEKGKLHSTLLPANKKGNGLIENLEPLIKVPR